MHHSCYFYGILLTGMAKLARTKPRNEGLYSAEVRGFRKEIGRPSARAKMALAALTAVEPLLDLFLRIGLTSPEVESLMRGVFVHKSREWLARQNGGQPPSNVRVSLVSGVHRNFVHRILAEPPRIAPARERRANRIGPLLQAWHNENQYLDDSGKPRDLPERGESPSFLSLVREHLPGTSPSEILQALLRSGVVESLPNHRVRVRSQTVRQLGITLENVTELGLRAKAIIGTLIWNLDNVRDGLFFESTPVVEIDADRMAVVREVISRRATTFLAAITQELTSEKPGRKASGRRSKISLAVIESKHV
jgi:hypothetical protein